MLRITGGKVYDPKNGVNGVVQDVCIADDKPGDHPSGSSSNC